MCEDPPGGPLIHWLSEDPPWGSPGPSRAVMAPFVAVLSVISHVDPQALLLGLPPPRILPHLTSVLTLSSVYLPTTPQSVSQCRLLQPKCRHEIPEQMCNRSPRLAARTACLRISPNPLPHGLRSTAPLSAQLENPGTRQAFSRQYVLLVPPLNPIERRFS